MRSVVLMSSRWRRGGDGDARMEPSVETDRVLLWFPEERDRGSGGSPLNARRWSCNPGMSERCSRNDRHGCAVRLLWPWCNCYSESESPGPAEAGRNSCRSLVHPGTEIHVPCSSGHGSDSSDEDRLIRACWWSAYERLGTSRENKTVVMSVPSDRESSTGVPSLLRPWRWIVL